MMKGGYMVKGACMVKGGVCGEGGHAWQWGACVARGACVICTPPLYEIRPVNARAVRILLECIFVYLYFSETNIVKT